MTYFFSSKNRPPPRTTRTDTRFPYTTPFRSWKRADATLARSHARPDAGVEGRALHHARARFCLHPARSGAERRVARRRALSVAPVRTRDDDRDRSHRSGPLVRREPRAREDRKSVV